MPVPAPHYALSTVQLMIQVMCDKPIPLAAQSKVWVCDYSLAGIAGSNPTRDMGVLLLCVLGVVG